MGVTCTVIMGSDECLLKFRIEQPSLSRQHEIDLLVTVHQEGSVLLITTTSLCIMFQSQCGGQDMPKSARLAGCVFYLLITRFGVWIRLASCPVSGLGTGLGSEVPKPDGMICHRGRRLNVGAIIPIVDALAESTMDYRFASRIS